MAFSANGYKARLGNERVDGKIPMQNGFTGI